MRCHDAIVKAEMEQVKYVVLGFALERVQVVDDEIVVLEEKF